MTKTECFADMDDVRSFNINKKVPNDVKALMLEAEVFCIDKDLYKNNMVSHVESNKDMFEIEDIDLPFKTISIELNVSDLAEADLCWYDMHGESVSKTVFDKDSGLDMYNTMLPSCPCVLITETEPRKYKGYMYTACKSGTIMLTPIHADELLVVVKTFLKCLAKAKIGSTVQDKKVKLKVRGKKRAINRVIYLCHRDVTEANTAKGRKIDFSYRFSVRGHWRRIGEKALGKNRAGDYCVHGMTWVSEHERGDEKKPLIKKVRVAA